MSHEHKGFWDDPKGLYPFNELGVNSMRALLVGPVGMFACHIVSIFWFL